MFVCFAYLHVTCVYSHAAAHTDQLKAQNKSRRKETMEEENEVRIGPVHIWILLTHVCCVYLSSA